MSLPDSKSRAEGEVSGMFAKIAPKYDMMNRAMCLGFDRVWRARLVRAALKAAPQSARVLDMACGSGDVCFEILKAARKNGLDVKITGADFCDGMLDIARAKAQKLEASEKEKLEFMFADCESLPFEDGAFDAVTISFGFRNFKDRAKCLKELSRVLKKGGSLNILEVARAPWVLKYFEDFAMRFVIPNAALLLGCEKEPYSYLAKTTREFPAQRELANLINSCGFAGAKYSSMAFGAVALTTANKI